MVAIPPPLLTAAALFRAWAADRLLRAQEAQKILEPLYHYTDAGGLKGIIESQQIWFTSHRYLNDPSELILVRQLMSCHLPSASMSSAASAPLCRWRAPVHTAACSRSPTAKRGRPPSRCLSVETAGPPWLPERSASTPCAKASIP